MHHRVVRVGRDGHCTSGPPQIPFCPITKEAERLWLVKPKAIRRKGGLHQQIRTPLIPLLPGLLRPDGCGSSLRESTPSPLSGHLHLQGKNTSFCCVKPAGLNCDSRKRGRDLVCAQPPLRVQPYACAEIRHAYFQMNACRLRVLEVTQIVTYRSGIPIQVDLISKSRYILLCQDPYSFLSLFPPHHFI